MRGHVDLGSREAQTFRKIRSVFQNCALLCVVGAAPILMNGCAGITSASNNSRPPAAIQVTPASVSFGSVVVGKKGSQTISITNTGSVAFNVSQVNLSGSQFSISGLAMPLSLPAGQSISFQVWFSASSAGNASGTLTVQTDTGVTSGPVALAGTATTAVQQIAVTPTSLNLGSAVIGTSTKGTVTVSNVGGSNLTVSSVSAGAGPFSVSGVATPSTVAAGASVVLNVTYLPTTAGSNSGTLTIASDDPQAPTSLVSMSGTATATAAAPTITAQPVSQTVTAGQAAGFTVVATGTAPLSYQWQKNGVTIAGATSASYTTPSTSTSDNGASFRVVVSNTAGTVTSSAATLTVNAGPIAPAISAQPVNQTVTAGQTASFVVVATGTAPLTYQWQKSGVNIAGANSASYTTPATTTSDNGATFRVVVSNTAGTITSVAATLTVNAAAVAPAITSQPATQTVTAGQMASFAVVATGTAPLTYQWQKSGVNIAGANSASYTTPATTTSDNGATFRVVVSNTAGTVISAAATLMVNAAVVAPTITAQPASQAVVSGQTAGFSVTATGTAPLTYQWQKNGVTIAGATLASYTTPATTTADNGATFRVVVGNTAGSATSAAATLTVSAVAVAPTITTQPVNLTVTSGQTASFVVAATGTAPLSYQWQKNGVNIAGATASSYTTPATTTSDNGATFAAVVSNTAGTVTSAAAILTVNVAVVAPTITAQPVNQTVTAGQTASFSVTATGTAPLSYQWQKNGVNIAGATSASYTTPATTTTDNGSTFGAVVSNTAGSVTSAAATLTVNAIPAPVIQVNPTSMSFANTVVGASSSQALIIRNTGTATLTISQLTATGSGFSVNGFSLPLNVAAGQQTTITVVFLAPAVGATPGNISIVSNAATSPTSVSLSGTGIAATFTLGISPASLSFGNVTTGTSSAAQNVVITDTGNSSVAISAITLSGAGYTMTGGSAPVTLTPLQSVTLSVQFSPNAAGLVNGNISIVSNASGSPAAVSLTGTGVAPHWVALSWNASSTSVTGYNIYRSTVNGGAYAKISSLVSALTYNDLTVQNGTTYYYVTTAVDSQGTESVFSNQVVAVIP